MKALRSSRPGVDKYNRISDQFLKPNQDQFNSPSSTFDAFSDQTAAATKKADIPESGRIGSFTNFLLCNQE